MAGADVTMMCSILLRRGIGHIAVIEREMLQWMEEHEYESVEQLKGSMSQKNCPDPSAFERAQYMRALSTYPRPATHPPRAKVSVKRDFSLNLYQKSAGSHYLLAVEPHIEITSHAVDVGLGKPLGPGVLAVL